MRRYAFAVFCTVYLLRRGGVKLPREDVLAVPFQGWLYFGRDTRKFYPSEVVRLFQDERALIDVVEPLMHPYLKKIERGGMLFRGSEEIRSSVHEPQAWWVVPSGPAGATMPP